MAAIIRKMIHGYEYFFEDLADQRLMSWPLVSKPYQVIVLLTLYLMFVFKWGPKWMKKRKPFNVEKIMIVYNAVQVVACSILFVQSILAGWGWRYKWVCQPSNFENTPEALLEAKLTYFYFILKVVDLIDTVFYVLRKKNNQITFLHVYHHTGMVALIWGAITYYPGGHGSLVGVINCFVHAIMYSYYLLTVAKPSFKNIIWIKRSITQLQILQFLICVVHMAIIIFKPDCEYPRWISAVFLPQNMFMLALFLDFYRKTYLRNPRTKTKEDLNEKVTGKENKTEKHKNGHVKNKSDLNKIINGNAGPIVREESISEDNGHFCNVNGYKNENNHCENIIQYSKHKYKKYH